MTMLKDTMRPLIGPTVFAALWICLIAIALSGCGSVPKFPAKTIWEVDVKSGVCGEYQIVEPKTLKVKHVADHPLSKCNGVFGFSTSDTPKVLDWCSDLVVLAEKNCSK